MATWRPGGFQIGKGVWEGDWKDPNCPKAQKKRDGVLKWMDAYMDYGMILDIPAWVSRSKEGAKATGISTYAEAVKATRINNDYWMKNRTGDCKFKRSGEKIMLMQMIGMHK